MKSAESKLKIVNAILASRSESERDFFIQSDRAIDYALSQNQKLRSAGEFAASILRICDPETSLEYLDLSAPHFDPLFLLSALGDSVKRLAGCKRPLLIIEGLEKSALGGGKRWSKKKRIEYAENLATVEALILRYEACVPNLEIVFV